MERVFNSQTTYVCKKMSRKKHKMHTYAKLKKMKKSNTLEKSMRGQTHAAVKRAQ